jgi:hypothetical protein
MGETIDYPRTFESQMWSLGPCWLPPFGSLPGMRPYDKAAGGLHSAARGEFTIGDYRSLPESLGEWRRAIAGMPVPPGYAGLRSHYEVDETVLTAAGAVNRHPLHVDGPQYGDCDGFVQAFSAPCCMAWLKEFEGEPDERGGCAHLGGQCPEAEGFLIPPGIAWFFGPLCVHGSVPMAATTPRQFCRVVLPGRR